MIQPWYRKKYGIAAPDAKRHELKLRYRFNVKEIPETDFVFAHSPGIIERHHDETVLNRDNRHKREDNDK